MPKVRRIAHRLKTRLPSHIDVEELEADGYVGLVKAAERWDPTRGTPFAAYAWWWITGEIIEGLRRTYRQINPSRTVSLDEMQESMLQGGKDQQFAAHDEREPEKDAAEARLDAATILALLKKSNNSHGKRQAKILVSRHFKNRMQIEIAEEMGITKARVSQLCAEARKQARRVGTADERR